MASDTYKEIRIFRFPGLTAKVYIPDLTEEERTQRMSTIHKQVANLFKKG